MSGIYLHIPFCKQACHYCDFHFSTNTSRKAEMIKAISKEIVLQKEYLTGSVNTIYFGGGTPSLLSPKELELLLSTLHDTFDIHPKVEVTLEANPDDLQSKEQLAAFHDLGINRLSIGIQSFDEAHLNYLNRAHNAKEALQSVDLAQSVRFENITIDLIYGIPAPNHTLWESDLAKAMQLDVPHISAYCLTIEENTAFGNWLKKGKIKAVEDDFAAEQFDRLLNTTEQHGFEQYEISNFAREGKYSQHNRNYWRQIPYLGIGPGAHSFNGASRQFNIRNNALYIKALEKNEVPAEIETLSRNDFINEYLMTSLRTSEGCDLNYLKTKHQYNLKEEQEAILAKWQRANTWQEENSYLKLNRKGKLLADEIIGDLFIV